MGIISTTTQIKNHNLPPSLKIEIWNSKLVFLLLLLASTHNSSISMNRLIKSICLVLIVFNLLNQSAHKRYITMDIDDANNGVAMNCRQLRLHHCHRYQAFVIIHLKESTESRKASVQPHIDIPLTVEESTRMLRFKKELIATNNFRRGRLSTSRYLTLRNCSHRSSSSNSNSTFPKNVDGMTTIRFYYSNYWSSCSVLKDERYWYFTFFNEICERRCRNQYHPDCNDTRTIDLM